jgi:hypothetical protein
MSVWLGWHINVGIGGHNSHLFLREKHDGEKKHENFKLGFA